MHAVHGKQQGSHYRGSEGVDLNVKNIISKARRNKAQITLEFLLVYSLVLIVFLIIFALIVAQRASTLASQEYSSMQLVAQTVSTAIDTALSSGSGYTATVQLPSAFGTAPYNLSISSTGVIIASMLVGKEVVSAQAFSNARSLVVNGTVVASGNGITLYKVPAYKGSVYIANSNGVIYIDQQSVSTLALARYLNVNVSFNGKAAQFNGQNGYIGTSNIIVTSSNTITETAWVYMYPTTQAYSGIAYYGSQSTCGQTFAPYMQPTGLPGLSDWCNSFNPSGNGNFNNWNFVAFVQNGANVALYYNNEQFTGVLSTDTLNMPIGTGEPVDIGSGQFGAGQYFHGYIADIQLYNTSLSAAQVQQLYQEGIGGAPISNAGLVGWWPLNGNANDYSGNGNQGTPYNVNFMGLAQINAHVTNYNGANAAGDLVGFTSTSGNFSTSNKGNFAAYTNSNGIVTAFLTGIGTAPTTANITVTAFNGNYTTIGNVVSWWPLNIGTGNIIYDLSTHYNNGAFTNPAWPQLANSTNFISAQFPGNLANTAGNSIENGFITINNTDIYTIPANRTFTVVAWIYYKGETSSHCQGIFGDWPNPGPGFQLIGWGCGVLYVNGSSVSWPSGVNSFPKGRWEMITAEYTARTGMAMVYLNNSVFASQQLPTSLSLLQKIPYYIGDDAWQPGGYDTFNGSISNVQLYSTFLTSSQINTLYNEGINGVPLNNAGLVGWWPLNGNANDYSGNGNNGKINYNVSFINSNEKTQYAYSVASFGASTADQIIVNHEYFQGNSFTILAWVYWPPGTNLASPGTSNGDLGYAWSGPAATDEGFGIFSRSDHWYLNFFGDDLECSAGPVAGRWYQFGASWDASTKLQTIWVNGAANCTRTSSGSLTTNSPLYIGSGAGTWDSGAYMDGLVADIQIYNTSLSAAQIQQLYHEGINSVPLNNAGLVSWWPLNGNANDYSGNGNNGKINSDNVSFINSNEKTQYAYSVAQFNGYTSLITTPSLSRQIPTNSQITITAWINVASLTSAGGAGCGAQRDIINLGGNDKFYLQASSGSSSTGNFPAVDILWVSNSTTDYGAGPGPSAPPIIPDQWFFIAGTNSNQHECAYLDSSGSCGPGLINMNSPGGGVIGWSDGCGSSFNGSIADVQVYNTSLSAAQVQQLYQAGLPTYKRLTLSLG